MKKLIVIGFLAVASSTGWAQVDRAGSPEWKAHGERMEAEKERLTYKRCERGYWVNYGARVDGGSPYTLTDDRVVQTRQPMTTPCAPEGAVCQRQKVRYPNGAVGAQMASNPPGVKCP